ncbi:MAG TPA: FAD-dependent monooxygenase [Pseudolabrys sp.]|uniref:FAD-dependent monooxygenase n=1 Tax=Pseudolabrys sp. TaxID=1960880 RepID=UPI002DDCB3E2|nr:FAD-dependent monooxygenase [Pseudolabrys sp.]HEV2628785.1 FAD-dependent monooxygenase [Pseudolabrys sp.]
MTQARHVIVAGAGIAGLTAALTMAKAGLRVTLLEQADRLLETGAGLQLSPNATRVLTSLGLRERLLPHAVAPHAIRVMSGGSGREIVRIPLADAEKKYGAPFWVLHRADLQAALVAAAQASMDITLKLGTRVEDFAAHVKGVSVLGRQDRQVFDERGMVLIGADGIWSNVAARLKRQRPAQFAHRTAWRALIPADSVPAEFRAPFVHLWLGLDAHLVHYPVKGGSLINIVGIVHDEWNEAGWSAPGEPKEILRHFARWTWHDRARDLIATPKRWLKWALYERKAAFRGGEGPVSLIGDAAHPMLPFLAQGAGMAIEDAAVLAWCLKEYRDDPADALRAYEGARRLRTARAQQVSHKQGTIYGRSGPEALVRNLGMKFMGGDRLRAHYDWIYTWRSPEETGSLA